jgi:2-oxoglutarate dehydrogenase E1 component
MTMHADQEIKLAPDEKMRQVVICSGKVYFDLYEEREARGIDDIYLLRVEQLYPFPLKATGDLLSRFPDAEVVWCQEEPQNMGGWTFVEPRLSAVLDGLKQGHKSVRYAGRAASASTATGLMSKHLAQRDHLIDEALNS